MINDDQTNSRVIYTPFSSGYNTLSMMNALQKELNKLRMELLRLKLKVLSERIFTVRFKNINTKNLVINDEINGTQQYNNVKDAEIELDNMGKKINNQNIKIVPMHQYRQSNYFKFQ